MLDQRRPARPQSGGRTPSSSGATYFGGAPRGVGCSRDFIGSEGARNLSPSGVLGSGAPGKLAGGCTEHHAVSVRLALVRNRPVRKRGHPFRVQSVINRSEEALKGVQTGSGRTMKCPTWVYCAFALDSIGEIGHIHTSGGHAVCPCQRPIGPLDTQTSEHVALKSGLYPVGAAPRAAASW